MAHVFSLWRLGALPRMSALGQKQTSEVPLPMSALPPKADIPSGMKNVR
jgi:hypothetical protein